MLKYHQANNKKICPFSAWGTKCGNVYCLFTTHGLHICWQTLCT